MTENQLKEALMSKGWDMDAWFRTENISSIFIRDLNSIVETAQDKAVQDHITAYKRSLDNYLKQKIK